MSLLRGGVGRTVIALWLGHESMESTQVYIHADMTMKEKAMRLTDTMSIKSSCKRFIEDDSLLAFLEAL